MSQPFEIDVIFTCGVNNFLPAVDVWIVIDILRATTVMTRWFELGGTELYPVDNPDEARKLVAELKKRGSSPLLMGEVNGIPPEGFDLGNSPIDLNYEIVREHYCGVMSTTNGTVALIEAASTGSPVIASSLRNSTAVLNHALTFGNKIGILCAGRRRHPGWDDIFCAGAIIRKLKNIASENGREVLMTDSARVSLLVWDTGNNETEKCIRKSEHAIYLEKIGYGNDISFACEHDVSTVVPMMFTDENSRNILRSVSGSYIIESKTKIENIVNENEKEKEKNPFEELLGYNKKIDNYFFIGDKKYKKNKK